MNRITQKFQNLHTSKRKLFLPYITAGFPRKDQTVDLLLALDQAGSDIIELGVPFSDPVADGPLIQESSFIALNCGLNLYFSFIQL